MQPLPSVLALSLPVIPCIVSSPFSNVPQLEMSKLDDRGSEESANQASVSQSFGACPLLPWYYCVSSTPHPTLFIFFHPPWLSSFTSSSNTAELLQANVIVGDCVCPWINHSDTSGLGNKRVIKSEWLTHVRKSARLHTDTHSLGFMDRLKTEKAHQAIHTHAHQWKHYTVRDTHNWQHYTHHHVGR